MAKWYTVNYGAIVHTEVFEDKAKAEEKARLLTNLSGHKWHVELVFGYDK